MPTDDQERRAHNDRADAATRAVILLRAGAGLFAVFAEEVEASARDLTPTPLPFAPRAVVGVVSLRGRIRTVIDPLLLAGPATNDNPPDGDKTNDVPTVAGQTRPRLFVALAGDGQLALACDASEGESDIEPSRVAPAGDTHSHLRGTFERGGERVALLDPSRLFDAATRGTERRRRRS